MLSALRRWWRGSTPQAPPAPPGDAPPLVPLGAWERRTREGIPIVKLLAVGPYDCGKSALMRRWVDDDFEGGPGRTTIGIDFKIKNVEYGDEGRIQVQVWDSASQERFREITNEESRGADGIMIVYDVCRRDTFVSLADWHSEVQQHARAGTALTLVGNKSDQIHTAGREVSVDEGEAFAIEHGMQFFEVSAREGTHVDEAFGALLQAAMGGGLPPEPPPLAVPCAEAPVAADIEANVDTGGACTAAASSVAAGAEGGVGGADGGSSSSSSSSSSSDDESD